MAVKVSETSVTKLWRHNEGSLQIAVKSSESVKTLLEVCGRTVQRLNAELDSVVLLEPSPTPQGVAIFIDSCDDKKTLLRILTGLADDVEGAGIEAKIGPFRAEYSPLDDPFLQLSGYSAGLTLVGEPFWEDDGNPPGMRRVWDADPAAQERVIDHALRWCAVDGGELWLRGGVSIYKITLDQASGLLRTAIRTGKYWTDLIAADGTNRVRHVCFARNGHVMYEVGGTDGIPWQDRVHELQEVLVDLHESVVWGFVEARLRGTSGIGVARWDELQDVLWEPHRDRVRHSAKRVYTRQEDHVVPNAFGIQVLGPRHAALAGDSHWDVTELGGGRRLVAHTDPEAWFSRLPELDLLLSARQDFEPLLDPTRAPLSTDGSP